MKRVLLGTVVDKVTPHKERADAYFAPSTFQAAEGEDDTDSHGSLHTLHTTCMGIRTQR